MTKQEARELVEATGAKVLAVRMSGGKPQVAISWRDYLKVHRLPQLHKSFEIVQQQ